MTIAKLDEIVHAVEDIVAADTESARIDATYRALTLARELRRDAVEGWVFLDGMDSAHQDAANVYDTEPDNHDGPCILIIDRSEP